MRHVEDREPKFSNFAEWSGINSLHLNVTKTRKICLETSFDIMLNII